ncbi:NepR family anti-sigma factor [uncultured Tateyamaria sp.]|uniref:NepR family anti-sigma factor n=1 Tax=uncultured Tateyamaria sp. TaxID=455651 RepID=UPI002610A6E2|nr:NepR family anti-sigma factor [uncultured Tateyamaria sp.]
MTQKMNRAGKTSSVADEIDKNIKRAFDDVANQALPSRFTDLLDQLRAQDGAGSEGKHDK